MFKFGLGFSKTTLIDKVKSVIKQILRQYPDEAVEEIVITKQLNENDLCTILEEVYPQIVAYETDKAYKDSSETFDIDYWIDDAVGEIAAKKVSDSEENPDA